MRTCFLTFDSGNNIVSIDENVEKLTGFSKKELIGKPIHSLFIGEIPDFNKPLFTDHTYFCQRKSGRPIQLQVTLSTPLQRETEPEKRICLLQEKTEFHELKNIINLSPAIVFLWTNEEDWPVEFVSDNIRHFGYEPEDFYLKKINFTELIHKKDLERVATEVERYSKNSKCNKFKQCYRIVDKNGEVRWIDDYTIIRRDHEGEISHYQGVILDVTERVKAEEKLEIAERYQVLFENTTDFLLVYKPEGKILQCNNFSCEALGYSRKQLTHMNISSIEHPDYNILKSGDINFFKDQEDNFIETLLVSKDKNNISVQANFHVINYKGQKAILTIARNFQQEKQALQEIKRLATAIGQLPDFIVITEADGEVIYVNPAFVAITGFKRNEYEGKKVEELIRGKSPAEFDQHLYDSIWETINNGETWSGQVSVKKKNNSKIHLDLIISPVFDEFYHIINFIVIGRDVTQKTLFEEQLVHSRRLESLGTLASGIAHDLNNILMVIKAFTELAMDSLAKDEQPYHDLQEVMKAGDKCKHLIKQIISFSKKQESEKVAIKLHQVTIEAMGIVKSGLPTSIKLKQSLDNCGFILGDVAAIKQIIIQLCTNAYQSIKNKGEIEVTLKAITVNQSGDFGFEGLPPGDYANLCVRDDGCGMNDDVKERMFDPFFTTKKLGENGGMGLATVLGLVENLDGKIYCDTTLNQGSTFNIVFPKYEI